MGKIFLTVLLSLLILPGARLDAFAALNSATSQNSGEPLKLLRLTPSGTDVPPGRQLVFTFNRPVVPLGRMERNQSEIPVTIEPALGCKWRWLNTSSLACQLNEKNSMRPATRYKVVMRPGIKAMDGSTLQGAFTYTFITQRPEVTYSWFRGWASPVRPVIQVGFADFVKKRSLGEHLYFQTQNKERIPLNVTEDPAYTKNKNYKKGRIWLVSPQRELPEDEKIELRVEKGVVSLEGTEPGVEDRIIVGFHTFPKFRFIGVGCVTKTGESVVITGGSGEPDGKKCDPLGQIRLLFSAPVLKKVVAETLLVTPDLAGGLKDFDPWQGIYSYSMLSSSHTRGQTYSVNLPILKAFQPYHLQASSLEIKDEFGRALNSDIDIEFMTDHRTPNYHLGSNFFSLETGIDSEVPLVVTNLRELRLKYQTETVHGIGAKEKKTIKVDVAEDIAQKIPLKVREMLPASSGVIEGTFDTEPSIASKNNRDSWFFAQVSPYSVHVKIGHFNTLVWVTDFSTGEPVGGVKVDIYKDRFRINGPSTLSPKKMETDEGLRETLTTGTTDANGIAMLAGTEKIDPELNMVGSYYWNWEKKVPLFVRCIKGDGIAVVPLIYPYLEDARGANNNYISSWAELRYGHIRTWGTTAQGIYKAGDTIQYKFYVRDQNNKTFIPAPEQFYTLKVVDPMGKTVHEVKKIKLSSFGAFDGEYTIAKNAAVGWYDFKLTADFISNKIWQPMRVLVSDFTPAPFRVITDLKGERFRPGDKVKVRTSSRLHAGGPYVNAEARVTASLSERTFIPDDPMARGFSFDASSTSRRTSIINQIDSRVDEKGDLRNEFTIGESPVFYGVLTVESSVRDDRGKYVAGSASAKFVGRDRYVGVLQKDWLLSAGKPATVKAIVVDELGKRVSGTPVNIKIEYQTTTAARVKGSGNAYITRYKHKWVDAAKCALTSLDGPVACDFTPENAGLYRIEASVKDTRGRVHSSKLRRWAQGKGRVLWEESTGSRLDIFPEKNEYKVGDKARFLVKNPYPGAKALVTVERYGVIKSWVETFEDSTEVVEFTVLPEYLPGYYLSVVVFSPRVEKPIDAKQVDLGKPAYKMGYVSVPVRDPYNEIRVDVKPRHEVYKPGDEVTVDFKANIQASRGAKGEPPMEIAVAVLDESVFDLIPSGRASFDPYRGFYSLEPLDLQNFSLLQQLVGRQLFEKKGASPGGDGGMGPELRSFFKFVSYWNPSVKTDKEGHARVSFKVPDNLTGWRVLAMAVTDSSRMGLGESTFKVNRPTEIRAALPNQLTEKDSFQAGFTVMNRTGKTRTLDVQISARGALIGGSAQKRRKIDAEPYKRYTVWMPIITLHDGEIVFDVRASDKLDADGLRVTIPVKKRASLKVAASYGTTTSDEVSSMIAFPEGIQTDVGGVSITASPTVIGNAEGAFRYMRDYPYMCWEQILTKGVMAANYQALKQYMPETFQWKESAQLPEETLELAAEHQASNGGMVYYIPEDSYVSPYLSAYTALAFNWLRKDGYNIPTGVEKRLHGYLQGLLKRDVMPSFYSKGMRATVRAVALAALAPQGKIDRGDISRYRGQLGDMSLFGKAQFLQAALKAGARDSIVDDVLEMILAHSNQTGGKVVFSEAVDSAYDRILVTPLRTNCVVLSSLLAYSEYARHGQEKNFGDLTSGLLRTITGTRGQRDRWENTQENMFCMKSLTDYSRVYEKESPRMELHAWLGDEPMGEAVFNDFRDKAVEFARPVKIGDPGRKVNARLGRKGQGRVYYSTKLSYAEKELKNNAVNSGIEIHREYSVERGGAWTLLGRSMHLKTGELVRVDLYVSLPADRNFVVVDDPVPGGLEPVNRELATTSRIDAEKGGLKGAGGSFLYTRDDWRDYGYSRWSFYHKELRHNSVRYYSEHLSAGNYHLSYVAQAIAPGKFIVMPAHAEEMYHPDVFGEGFPASLEVMRNE